MMVPKARVIKATKRLLPPMNTRKARHKVGFPRFLLSLSFTLTVFLSEPAPPTGYTTNDGVQVDHHEAEKPWWDLNDDKKKKLVRTVRAYFSVSRYSHRCTSKAEGGGLALGLALIGGGAYYMHEKHKKGGEEEKAQAFEVQNWMRASQQRTEEFLKSGPRSPATWVLANPHMGFMHDALQGGESNGVSWFIARAPHAVSHHISLCQPCFILTHILLGRNPCVPHN